MLVEIRRLVVLIADDNPIWGYTRIQEAPKNVGHRIGRSTIARILTAHGSPTGAEATDVVADVSPRPQEMAVLARILSRPRYGRGAAW